MITMAKSNYDKYNRYRSIIVSFRASPEENEMLNKMVKLSGMTKQGYIRTRLECKDVVVNGNPRVYKGVKELLIEIRNRLSEISDFNNSNDKELLELIGVITNVLSEMKKES